MVDRLDNLKKQYVAWADLSLSKIDQLIERTKVIGWREALKEVRSEERNFVHRISNIGLSNWHMLLAKPNSGPVLDIGCGFGTLIIGLAHYYLKIIGIDFLTE